VKKEIFFFYIGAEFRRSRQGRRVQIVFHTVQNVFQRLFLGDFSKRLVAAADTVKGIVVAHHKVEAPVAIKANFKDKVSVVFYCIPDCVLESRRALGNVLAYVFGSGRVQPVESGQVLLLLLLLLLRQALESSWL